MYDIFDDDIPAIKAVKTEANLRLASVNDLVSDSIEFLKFVTRVNYVIKVLEITNQYNTNEFTSNNNILEDSIKLMKGVPLYSITFKDEEFIDGNEETEYNKVHSLYSNIIRLDVNIGWDNMYRYINTNAYNIEIKRKYRTEFMSEYIDIEQPIHKLQPFFITRGGVTTGQYIRNCYIHKHDIDNQLFSRFNPIIIPVNEIVNHDGSSYYLIDERDSKFKELLKYYEVPINFDVSIRNLIDIRKYTKLK